MEIQRIQSMTVVRTIPFPQSAARFWENVPVFRAPMAGICTFS